MLLNLNTVGSVPALGMQPATVSVSSLSSKSMDGDFASLLGRLASEAAVTVQQGEAAAVAGISGTLPLQTVVERVMAAERTLQAALAVRDKAVGAYQELSRMQL